VPSRPNHHRCITLRGQKNLRGGSKSSLDSIPNDYYHTEHKFTYSRADPRVADRPARIHPPTHVSLPRPLTPLVTILHRSHHQNAAFTGLSAQTSLHQLFIPGEATERQASSKRARLPQGRRAQCASVPPCPQSAACLPQGRRAQCASVPPCPQSAAWLPQRQPSAGGSSTNTFNFLRPPCRHLSLIVQLYLLIAQFRTPIHPPRRPHGMRPASACPLTPFPPRPPV